MKLFGSVCLGLVGFAIAQTPEARRSKYNNTTKRPTTKAPTTPYDDNEDGGSTGGASGDPHFMVQSEGREPLCFDFNPPAGSEMNLVVDPESNLVVSAQVNARTRHKTYMTNIHFSSPMGAYLEFDLDGVHLKGLPEGSVSVHPVTGHKQYGDINYAEHWNEDGTRDRIEIEIENGPKFLVKEKVDKGSLKFGITDSTGISHKCRGIIGQFMRPDAYTILPKEQTPEDTEARALVMTSGMESGMVEAIKEDFHRHHMCWTIDAQEVLLLLAQM